VAPGLSWRTKTYSPEYILKQVGSSKGHGGIGFLFWNARNDYAKPFAAMPVMLANPKIYLQIATPATTTAASSPARLEKPAAAAAEVHQ